MITTFYSLSNSGTTIGRYLNIVLMISCHTFFFSKKMVYSLSVSIFMAKASNSIIKSTMFFFPYLKDSILHSTSTVFILSSLTNSSQFWVSNFLSSSLSFFCIYMPTISLLRCTRIAIILSSVFMTLLLLRNNCIPLHQSSNFVWSSSNYSRSGTMLFSIIAYALSLIVTGASATDISLSDCLYISSKASFVICKDPSLSDSASILSVHLELISVLLVVYATHVLFFVQQ